MTRPGSRTITWGIMGLLTGSVYSAMSRSFWTTRPASERKALASGEGAETVRQELAQLRQSIVAVFRKRFERAVENGDLPKGTDCATLGRYVATVLNGLAVQAASGTPEKELRL